MSEFEQTCQAVIAKVNEVRAMHGTPETKLDRLKKDLFQIIGADVCTQKSKS